MFSGTEQRVAFIDTETTGWSQNQHEVIEIGVVIARASDLDELKCFERKVKPLRLEHASHKALEINGFDPKRWEGAPYLVDVLKELKPYLDGAIIGGHNVSFDLRFLEVAWEKHGHRPEGMTVDKTYDTMLRARALGLPSSGLSAVCTHYSIPQPVQHRALADARASLACARVMPYPTELDLDEEPSKKEVTPPPTRTSSTEALDPHVDVTLGMKRKDAHRGTSRPYFTAELRELKRKRNSLTVPG